MTYTFFNVLRIFLQMFYLVIFLQVPHVFDLLSYSPTSSLPPPFLFIQFSGSFLVWGLPYDYFLQCTDKDCSCRCVLPSVKNRISISILLLKFLLVAVTCLGLHSLLLLLNLSYTFRSLFLDSVWVQELEISLIYIHDEFHASFNPLHPILYIYIYIWTPIKILTEQ